MILHHILFTVRQIRRHRVQSLVGAVSLAIGIACSLLAALYVGNELQYDRHHVNVDRIVRTIQETRDEAGEHRFHPGTSGALIEEMRLSLPEVEAATRV